MKKKDCLIWFSGFFGLGALVHLIRLILQVPLMIGSFEVPLRTSVFVLIVFGALSIALLFLSYGGRCCKNE